MNSAATLQIAGTDVAAVGSLDLLEARLVHVAGNLDPTAHGAHAAEQAALALMNHSGSCALVHDGPGIAAAALDALVIASPARLVVLARRGLTEWHLDIARRGALVLDGPIRQLIEALADTVLVVEQSHAEVPRCGHIASIPGPILTPATAGSNALLLQAQVEIVPDLEAWARRLAYRFPRERSYKLHVH